MRLKIRTGDNTFKVKTLDDATVHGLLKALNARPTEHSIYYRDDTGDWIHIDIFDAEQTGQLLQRNELTIRKRNDVFTQYDPPMWIVYAIMFLITTPPGLWFFLMTDNWSFLFLATALNLFLICLTPEVGQYCRRNLLLWLAPELVAKKEESDYAAEHAQLASMGFDKAATLLPALRQTNGDKKKAITLYLQKK